VLPRLATSIGSSRVNVIDEGGRRLRPADPRGGGFTVGRPFPTTLYNWRLQVGLTSAEELGQKVERQRLRITLVAFAAIVAIASVAIVVIAAVKSASPRSRATSTNVSHELKTPLSPWSACSARCSSRVASRTRTEEAVPPDHRQRGERLTALIENVLDFAKVERGKAADFAPGQIRGGRRALGWRG
jgi:two-component system phosphate regulon sensor histidine kinase PhoR